MKIALCLTGMALHPGKKTVNGQMWDGKSGKRTPVEWRKGLEHYRKHILAHNDVDVFIHTPSVDAEQDLVAAYNPKATIFESDPRFNTIGAKVGNNYSDKIDSKSQITIARWYGIQRCVQLKKQYEMEHEFKYDMVMIGRFDVAWMVDVHFDQFDQNHFYASNWCVMKMPDGQGIRHADWFFHGWDKKENKELRHTHTGYPHTPHYPALADYWFFGGSEIMDQFGNLYDNIGKFLREGVPSNHEFAFRQLQVAGLLSKLKFAFHIHNDVFLARFVYFDWRK
ncbi:hypothetical protein LCGC14_0141900 [marine sediment metagenome]|uniref:Uncharacterized protein n=1 Tax=marine sediment metagenome TaxID=412755 RepID=A0A0F9V145_9ZZZZ